MRFAICLLLLLNAVVLAAPEADQTDPPRVESIRTNESAFLGAAVTSVDDATRAMFNSTREQGVLIQDVMAGTPAAAAGLQGGDIITELNGVTVREALDFIKQIRALKPGDPVTLKFDRNGKKDVVAEARLAGRVMPPIVMPGPAIVAPQPGVIIGGPGKDVFIRIPASRPTTAPAAGHEPDAKR